MTDAELAEAIKMAQEQARSRRKGEPLPIEGVTAPDLMPIVHARDAAEAKVASIGLVNPRHGGPVNALIQTFKKTVSRALGWFVRDQIEFNRGVMSCVQATLEALTETNRTLAALAAHQVQVREEMLALNRERSIEAAAYRDELVSEVRAYNGQVEGYHKEADELKDIRKHWVEWRASFEERRSASEIHMLRSISELQGAFTHRVTLMEENFRKMILDQHGLFDASLAKNTTEVQELLWKDLERIRSEYEALIYRELKVLRQKQAAAAPAASTPGSSAGPVEMPIDWLAFGDRFRGSEERISTHQKLYTERFAGTNGTILDIGCGRGEFLEAARDAGLSARGIELNDECIALCASKGLTVEKADLFEHLEALPDASLAGVYCSQVIEHLPPDRLPGLVKLIGEKLRPGGLAAFETPNPECLAIFSTHFYIDPTHTRPVPSALMAFYLEESGFSNIDVVRLEPAEESLPAVADLPKSVREAFFGGLDYAIFGRKV